MNANRSFILCATDFSPHAIDAATVAAKIASRRWAFVGAGAMVGVQILFAYVPVMNRLFHSAPISGESWLRIIGVAATVFTIVEVEKWFRYGGGRGAHALPE